MEKYLTSGESETEMISWQTKLYFKPFFQFKVPNGKGKLCTVLHARIIVFSSLHNRCRLLCTCKICHHKNYYYQLLNHKNIPKNAWNLVLICNSACAIWCKYREKRGHANKATYESKRNATPTTRVKKKQNAMKEIKQIRI